MGRPLSNRKFIKLQNSFKIIQLKDQKDKKRDRQTDMHIHTEAHMHVWGVGQSFAPGTQGYLRKKTERESLFEIIIAERLKVPNLREKTDIYNQKKKEK